jgi:F-type H+-transporting ATPase subunit delta
MTNPRLATRYAKSLIGLAQEKNVLEAVIADMKFFSSLQKTNPDFTALLRSPIINADKKEKIINAIPAQSK